MRATSKVGVGVAVLVASTVAAAGSATANRGNDERTVRMQDDCDAATFNAVLGEGACVGDGDTTFEELVDQLLTEGDAQKWRNSPDRTHVDHGRGLHVVNEGGEAHTFTEVAAFGPGCVAELNDLLGLTGPSAADCGEAFATVVPAAGAIDLAAAALPPGTHFFQCMIHPWMHTTVTVRSHHRH